MVSFCLGSRWFLFGLMVVGMSFYVMMSGSWGHCQSGVCSLTIRSLVMIFRGGVRGVGDDVHRDQGTYCLMLDLELSCSLVGVPVFVIRWVVVDCVC